MARTFPGSGLKFEKKIENPFARRSPVQILTVIFGVVAILASMWAGLLFPLAVTPYYQTMKNSDGYKPAMFVIKENRYIVRRGTNTPTSSTSFFAEGTINGKKESFSYGAYLKGEDYPSSVEDLDKLFPVGRQLSVLYNPDMDSMETRIIDPSDNLKERSEKRFYWILRVALMPMGIALGLCLICSAIARTWTGLKFAIGCICCN